MMMTYPVWKISLSSKEYVDNSLKNLLDKNIENTCDMLLIEDMFINKWHTYVQSGYTLGHVSSLTLRGLTNSWKLNIVMLLKKNTVPVTLILHILGIFRRTLFQWHWYCTFWEYSREHFSSDIDTVHFGNIQKNTVLVTLILYVLGYSEEHCSSDIDTV